MLPANEIPNATGSSCSERKGASGTIDNQADALPRATPEVTHIGSRYRILHTGRSGLISRAPSMHHLPKPALTAATSITQGRTLCPGSAEKLEIAIRRCVGPPRVGRLACARMHDNAAQQSLRNYSRFS